MRGEGNGFAGADELMGAGGDDEGRGVIELVGLEEEGEAVEGAPFSVESFRISLPDEP